ncbi:MAG: hypothetical protein EA402_10855 [Planctomycetota bacterium]|nr:MAG: hypothetical protein EA402_10855 [Planctomycetota bacterium]
MRGNLIALAPGDQFACIQHRLIRRGGGPGNRAALHLRLAGPGPQACPPAIAQRWRQLIRACPLLMARWQGGWLRRGWRLGKDVAGEAAVQWHWQGGEQPTFSLEWDHRLCDVRAALALLRALGDDQALAALAASDHRQRAPAALPVSAAQRGSLARGLPALMKPFHGGHWQPRRCPGAGLQPLQRAQIIVDEAAEAPIRAAQRAATGRFGEGPWQLAALARALYRVAGARGRLILPMAVDLRTREEAAACINGHGFCFASLDAAAAEADVASAAQTAQAAQKAWVAAGGVERILAGLSFAAPLPFTLIRGELGFGRPGLGASAVCGLSGRNELPALLAGFPVLGVDHAVLPPPAPGLALLIHRDPRGLVIDCLATAAVAPHCPPGRLLAELRSALAGEA